MNNQTVTSSSAFAVGDRVRVYTKPSNYNDTVGTILRIDGCSALVNFGGAYLDARWFRLGQLEKLPGETTPPAFAVGDRVRVLPSTSTPYAGCCGTIDSILSEPEGLLAYIRISPVTRISVFTRNLERVTSNQQRGPGSAEMQSLKAQSECNAGIEAVHKVALSPVVLPDTPEDYVKREASARCALIDRAEKAEKKYALACEYLAILQKQYDELDAQNQRHETVDELRVRIKELYTQRDGLQQIVSTATTALSLCRAPLGNGTLSERVSKLVIFHGNQVDTINKQNAELQALKQPPQVAAAPKPALRFFQHTAPDNFGAGSQWRVAEVAADGSVTMILADGSRTSEPVSAFFGMADNYVKNGIWVEVKPRRFRSSAPGGFADGTTDYIECFPRDISFLVRKDGTRKDLSAGYPLSWCEETVRGGHWVEVTS